MTAMRRCRPAGLALVIAALAGVSPAELRGQDAAVVEAVAPMISAEDARRWSPDGLQRRRALPGSRWSAASRPWPSVEWEILRGTALLIPLLQDPDSTVQTAAAFALGLVRDTAAVGPLIARLAAMPPPTIPTGQEIVTALAKIGGPRAAELVGAVLDNTANVSISENRSILVLQAAVESWRLGAIAPTRQLLALAQQDNVELRWRVIFSLGQLRSPDAGEALLNALRDAHPLARGYAARGLTASYAATARLEPDVVVQVLLRATTDEQPGVRINALRSLGTFARPDVSDRIAARADRSDAECAGRCRERDGPLRRTDCGSAALADGSGGQRVVRPAAGSAAGPLARQRRFVPGGRCGRGVPAPDGRNAPPRRRDGAGWHPGSAAGHPDFLHDADGRVAAASLKGWLAAVPGPDPALLAAARSLLSSADVGVRSLAADAIARDPEAADLGPLAAAYPAGCGRFGARCRARRRWKLSGRWPTSHDAIGGDGECGVPDRHTASCRLRACGLGGGGLAGGRHAGGVRHSRSPPAGRWKITGSWLVVTWRSRKPPTAHPHVFIETDQRGVVEVELLGPEAPLTVVNFLTLLDRRYLRPGPLVPRRPQLGGAGWRSARRRLGRPRILHPRRDQPAPIRRLRPRHGPVGAGHRRQPVVPHARAHSPSSTGRYTVFGRVVGSPNHRCSASRRATRSA